jgi:tetratricopeptide (TPR) repeat protein
MTARRRRRLSSRGEAAASPPPTRSTGLVAAAVVAGLIALTVAAYWPVWQFDFVAIDDPQYVSANPHLAGGLSPSSVAWAFTSGREANWHPLTWISHLVDVELYGLNAGGHHVTNLILHAANTLLLFGLLRRMTGAPGRSAFVAAVFAVHPLHVESVAWIAERKDVLSAFLGLLTIGAYVRYVRDPGRPRYALVMVLFALGLMAKPMLVTLPILLLLLDWWPLRRADSHVRLQVWWPLVREKLPLVAMALASSLVTFIVQRRFGAVKSLESFPFSARLPNAIVSYVDYLRDVVWPMKLGMFYPFPASVPAARVLSAVVVLVLISALVWWFARKAPWWAVGWLWYLVMLVPVIGLVQVGGQARADRYMYLPLVGIAIAVAWGAVEAVRAAARRQVLAAAAVIVVVACTAVTHAQVQHWRDTVALWSHTADVTNDTNNFGVHFGLAEYLREIDRPHEAIARYEESIRRQPTYAESRYGLGQALLDAGQTERALAAFGEAVRLEPDYLEARMALGVGLARAGRAREAIAHFAEVVRLRPGVAEGHRHLALAFAVEGRLTEALPHFADAVRLDPSSAPARNDYGLSLAESGRTDEAVAQFAEARRLDPHLADAHYNLGRILAARGQVTEALTHLAEAVRLDPSFVDARLSLAVTYAQARRLDDAVRELREVLRRDPANARARAALQAIGR